MISKPDFKVTLLFDIACLRNNTTQTDGYYRPPTEMICGLLNCALRDL